MLSIQLRDLGGWDSPGKVFRNGINGVWHFFIYSPFLLFCTFPLKGSSTIFFFYHLNLIFWMVVVCGIANYGRRGLKTTNTWKFWSQNLSQVVSRRGGPGVSRHSRRGFKGQHMIFGTLRYSKKMIKHWCVLSVLPCLEVPSCCPSKPLGTTLEVVWN